MSDVAAAFDAVLHRGTTGETYNVGTDRERTVLDVARDILGVVDEGAGAGAAGDAAAKAAAAAQEAGGCNGAAENGSGGGAGGKRAAHPPRARIAHVRDRAFNDRRYYIGSDKLAALGWREEVGWEEGLRRTVAWYLGGGGGGDAGAGAVGGAGDGGGLGGGPGSGAGRGLETYWQGDLESALRPHPVLGAGGALTASGGGGEALAAAAAAAEGAAR